MEIIDSREASVSRLFGGDGQSVRERRQPNVEYQRKLLEAAKFYGEVLAGDRKMWQFQEAMTTGDFPLLFADIIDREMLADYIATTKSWPMFCKRGTVPDFRNVN